MKSLFDEDREHRYDPKQWQRLSRRLREQERPPVAWWQRWMPLGFAVLVGLLGWQLWQQQNLQRTVAELSTQLANNKNEVPAPLTRQSKTVTVYDTIYRSTVIETTEHVSASLPYSYIPPTVFTDTPKRSTTGSKLVSTRNNTEFASSFAASSDFATTDFQQFHRYRAFQSAGVIEGNTVTENSPPYFITELIYSGKIQKIPSFGLAFPTIPAPASAPYELPRASLWQRIKPKGYTVSAGIGGFKSWAYGSDDGNAFVDLNTEIILSKRFSLEAGTAYFARSFQTEGETNAPPTDLPTIPPRNVDDELEEISGRIQQLQFPIGLRYYAWQRNRLRFYLGAGLAPVLGLPSSYVRYEYEDESTDEEYTLSAPKALSTSLRNGALYGRIGAQAGLGKRWQIGLSVTVQQPLDSYVFDYQRPSWGRWRLGVGYELK